MEVLGKTRKARYEALSAEEKQRRSQRLVAIRKLRKASQGDST
jgi:hypothetical protein